MDVAPPESVLGYVVPVHRALTEHIRQVMRVPEPDPVWLSTPQVRAA